MSNNGWPTLQQTPNQVPAPPQGWGQPQAWGQPQVIDTPTVIPSKRSPFKSKKAIAAYVVGGLILIGSLSQPSKKTDTKAQQLASATQTTTTATQAQNVQPQATDAEQTSIEQTTVVSTTEAPTTTIQQWDEGSLIVGTDIPVGRYMTQDTTLSGCYWEITKDASGSLGSIIANDNTEGRAVVDLAKGQIFDSSNCGSWVKYHASSPKLTTFGEGTWMANTDIVPGRYRPTEAVEDGCYWERMSSLTSSVGGIIANDNVSSGKPIIDIASSDLAVKSHGCGTWQKVG